MKLIVVLIFFVSLSFARVTDGQNTQLDFPAEAKEFYFFFRLSSKSDIHSITRQISIDNVRNDTVWAYANTEQFLGFLKEGHDITLLPAPGLAPGVVMNDDIILSPTTTWNFYPTYPAYETLMADFQANYPDLCQVTTLTTLNSGRKILMAKISDNVAIDETEPEFLYTSSIHGDETTGYILMLHLIDYLLSNYGTNAEVTELVDNLEIYINPLSNPDGTYYGGNNSVSGARRYNANSVDLNRNYPDLQFGQHPDGKAWQPETLAFMDFATQHHIVASANFHGGSEVVNYPWDTWATLAADNNWWVYVSREYADTVHVHSVGNYMTFLSNGITNGYAWYQITGGRQDYMNYFQHCREVTIEISNTKLLPASQLETLWNYNWRSLILYMKEARYGIHGLITSSATGNPVAAKVFINGHDASGSESYSSANNGDYHRLIKAGTYTLEISAPCFQTLIIPNVTVTDHNTTQLNIQLVPSAGVSTAVVSLITAASATGGGNVQCEGGSPVTARGVCWNTTANPAVEGSHTSDGAGQGIFTSLITGLSPSTLYHVRAYATNLNGTAYGEDIAFTTDCGTITAYPWSETFENAGSLPNCWSQEYVTTPGLNWTCIAGSGNGNPAAAHGGTYNACLKDITAADNKTRLVSPAFNLVNLGNPVLKFWHTQAKWSTDQDQLVVLYKTSANGVWTILNTYTNNLTAWTEETISLPNPGSEYYIAFEGNAKYGYGVCIDDVSISGITPRLLTLNILPEGLFNGSGLNKAENENGDQFSGSIADQVTIELHNVSYPFALAGGPFITDLNTDGFVSLLVPPGMNASYYIVVKHRNSIETWSAVPVSLTGTSAAYDFTIAANQAYGNNLKLISGKYVLFSGDANQDGKVDAGDIIAVDNAAASFLAGYLVTDINGDGHVNADDYSIINTNSNVFIAKITP